MESKILEEKKILLMGGGGHCKSVLDCILRNGNYDQIGIIDKLPSLIVLGVPVIGCDDDLPRLIKEGWTDIFISVGSIGSTLHRRKLYRIVKNLGYNVPIIIDPSAEISQQVELSEGTFVGKNAIINVGSKVGICSIINTGAIVEHDCTIGNFSHISPGAILCGQVNIGDDSHIGAGSVVRQEISIGNNTLIGAGSVVVKDIQANVKAYGNPCKEVWK